MKKLTAFLTSMMMMVCMVSAPVQAAHTFENERTDEYCKQLLETCPDCYVLNADGVYSYTKCIYHANRNYFEPYLPNPGTYDRSDLLLSLVQIHPENKYLVKIKMNGELKGEAARLTENGIEVNPVDDYTCYAIMTAEQLENFPASEKVGYLLSLSAPLEEELTTEPRTTEYWEKYALVVSRMPDKLTYHIGEPLDLTGGLANVYYHNSEGADDEISSGNPLTAEGFTIKTDFDSSKPGVYTVHVSAADGKAQDSFTVEVVQDETIPVSVPVAAKGDLNADGTTDIMDVILLNKHILGVKELDTDAKKAADINGDGTLDSTDSLALLKSALGIPEQLDPGEGGTVSLSAKYAAQPVASAEIDEQTILGQTQFALELLRHSAKAGKNSLVSPYSVSQALGMTANGAAGDTLKEMETVLGGSLETLNPAFYTLRTRDTKDAKCIAANSIWMHNGYIQKYPVSKAFLQTNADYYGADAFAAPFDDTTVKDINNWVSQKTDKMIPSVIEKIPEDGVMYLINAVAFDAEWEKPYSFTQESIFTAADGTEQKAQMLYRDDFGRPYYKDAHAIGFRQDYKGDAYYFAAFVPEEGMTPEIYLDTLTAESLHAMLADPMRGKVCSMLPEFSYDFDIKLKDTLTAMGMSSAFVEGAESDFSRMAEDGIDNLFINDVYHKTHIEVTKMGTRAGAATAVEMVAESMPVYVRMDRPFLYMIADSETNLPIFIGIVNSLNS